MQAADVVVRAHVVELHAGALPFQDHWGAHRAGALHGNLVRRLVDVRPGNRLPGLNRGLLWAEQEIGNAHRARRRWSNDRFR